MLNFPTYYKLIEFKPRNFTEEDHVTENRNMIIREMLGIKRGEEISAQKKEDLKEYLSMYSASDALGQYLFPEEFELQEFKALSEEILAKFTSHNTTKLYFDPDDAAAQQLYIECYKICVHQTQFIDKNPNLDGVSAIAYKMMAIFSSQYLRVQDTLKSLNAFFKQYNLPLHDMFLHDIPVYDYTNPKFDLQQWKRNLSTLGVKSLKHFVDAAKIETIHGEVGNPKVPSTLEELLNAVVKIIYLGAEKYPELAKMFKAENAPSSTWERTIKLIEEGELKIDESGNLISDKTTGKIPDNIPNIGIELPKPEESKSKSTYYMVKLPNDSAIALILGKITDCCQSIGDHSESCVLDGIKLSNNGFYLIVKSPQPLEDKPINWENLKSTGQIVGQAYCWMGKDGSLVLDSIEVQQGVRGQFDIKASLAELGKAVHSEDPSINRVMIGAGGGTASLIPGIDMQYSLSPEKMQEGTQYYDSKEQFEGWVSKELQEAREVLRGKLPDLTFIFNLEHAKFINSLSDKTLQSVPYRHMLLSNLMISQFRNKEEFESFVSEMQAFHTTDNAKYHILLSEFAYPLSLCDFCKITDLMALDVETIKALMSCEAKSLYRSGKVDITDLMDLDVETIKALMSKNAIYCYTYHEVDIKSLASSDLKTIEAIISTEAIIVSETYEVNLNDLMNLGAETINALTCHNAMKLYYQGKVNLNDLKLLCVETIKAIVSYEMSELCKNYHLDIKDFIDIAESKPFDQKTIETLSSHNVLILYKRYKVGVMDLMALDHKTIEALLCNAASSLNTNYVDENLVATELSELMGVVDDTSALSI